MRRWDVSILEPLAALSRPSCVFGFCFRIRSSYICFIGVVYPIFFGDGRRMKTDSYAPVMLITNMNAWPCTCALSLRPVGAAPHQARAAQCWPCGQPCAACGCSRTTTSLLSTRPRQRLAPTQRTGCRAWQRTVVGHVSDESFGPDAITASS
ncbi:hypothetical protein EDB86DRAFT_1558569 [Lactarius hatsudake]|nr:hypothetical protein EDB86DRAFT_1558569 [Lactarius hatsudake]